MAEVEPAYQRWRRARRSCVFGVIGLVLTCVTAFAAVILIMSPIAATDAVARASAETLQSIGFVSLIVVIPLFLATNFFLLRALLFGIQGLRHEEQAQGHLWILVTIISASALLVECAAASILFG